MTRTDLHLLYQKETGDSLNSIKEISKNLTELDPGDNTDLRQYIEWLEETALGYWNYLLK